MLGCVISCGTVVFFQKSCNLSRSLPTNNNIYCAQLALIALVAQDSPVAPVAPVDPVDPVDLVAPVAPVAPVASVASAVSQVAPNNKLGTHLETEDFSVLLTFLIDYCLHFQPRSDKGRVQYAFCTPLVIAIIIETKNNLSQVHK